MNLATLGAAVTVKDGAAEVDLRKLLSNDAIGALTDAKLRVVVDAVQDIMKKLDPTIHTFRYFGVKIERPRHLEAGFGAAFGSAHAPTVTIETDAPKEIRPE